MQYSTCLTADLPVRMALGEAHVIALTKSGLAEAGVNVEALEAAASVSGKAAGEQPGVDRSSTTLVVKNLPYTATEADLMVSAVQTPAVKAELRNLQIAVALYM